MNHSEIPPDLKEPPPMEGEADILAQKAASEAPEIEQVSARAGMVGFFTFLSRLLGLARDTLIAYFLGTKEAADAFYVAFRIPNLLRRLLAEGSLTISFIPVFTEYLKKDRREAKRVADYTFTFLSLLLIVITAFGVIFAAVFVKMTAFGFTENPEKFALTVELTRITFPYILLVSLGALAMGILNSLKHFSTPAASPILLNVGIILGALLFSRFTREPSLGIAVGVIVGGVLQLALQIPPLIKRGFFPRFRWNPKDPGVKKILKLMLPSIYGSAVYQLNVLGMTFMASFLGTGAVSYLWYADRVMEFPLGVFAISFATVILPQLSEHAANRNIDRLKKTFSEGLEMILFVNLPATVGLVALAGPIIHVLFERGSFGPESTLKTAQALQFFAIGLPFISASRVTSSAFYALQDSKTPVKAANGSVLVNLIVGALLIKPLSYNGLALGVSVGALFNFVLQMVFLRKKLGLLGLRRSAFGLLKITVASAGMGAILYLLGPWLTDFIRIKALGKAISLMILIFTGAGVYFLLAALLKVKEVKPVTDLVRRKFKRRR